MEQLHAYVEAGGKILAEGEGMTFLARSFTVRQGGTAYEMAGILPIDCTMVDANPSNGYRTVQYEGIKLRGYENHSSVLISLPDVPSLVAPVYGLRGAETATPFSAIRI